MINVRKIQCLNAVLCLCFAYIFFSWSYILIALVLYLCFLGLGINVGLHRGFSHGNLRPDSIFGRCCLFFSVLACVGRPSDWVLVHRLHHVYTDHPLDPHSPLRLGRLKVFFNRWKLSEEIPLRTLLSIKRQLLRNKSLKFFDRYYFHMIAGYVGLLLFLGGWGAFIYAWCIPATGALLATSLVNTFCHDRSGNILNVNWISLISLGEGYHGYHHQYPKAMRFKNVGAFDISGWVLEKAVLRGGLLERNS